MQTQSLNANVQAAANQSEVDTLVPQAVYQPLSEASKLGGARSAPVVEPHNLHCMW